MLQDDNSQNAIAPGKGKGLHDQSGAFISIPKGLKRKASETVP